MRVRSDLSGRLCNVLDEQWFHLILQVGEDGVDDFVFGIRCPSADEFEHQRVDFSEVCVDQEGRKVLSVAIFDCRRTRGCQVRRMQRGEKGDDQGRLGQGVCVLGRRRRGVLQYGDQATL